MPTISNLLGIEQVQQKIDQPDFQVMGETVVIPKGIYWPTGR